MTREVNIKALVSHVVKGDGIDKCRICMGSTSEGQVYLSDTVMTDGDKPVTLSELLEVITGVEVMEESALPRGICRECYEATTAALRLRQLVRESARQWSAASIMTANIQHPTSTDGAYYICFGDNVTLIRDQSKKIADVSRAVKRMNCGYQGSVPIEKTRKRRRKINGVAVTIKCCYCNMLFHSPYHLNLHFKNSMKRACTHCSMVMQKEKLAKHLLRIHHKQVFSCNLCHQLFDDQKGLDRHTKFNHGPNTHHCQTCGAGFPIARALRAHGYTHTLFGCPSCSASFENRKCYEYHKGQCTVQKHHPESLYECHDCGSKYTKKPSLRIHIIQKHLNVLPHVCQICGKRSSNTGHAKAHEAIHMAERKIYQCYCGAKMRTQLGYLMHQRIHTGERPYECPECGDRFLSASRRLDHIMRRHRSTKDMKHACKQCGARFLRPFELKKHQTNMHGVE